MLLRGRSKESKDRNRKVTPPGPVYMSNDQFAAYLSDLRSNRVTRPSGARPQPSSGNSRRESKETTHASPADLPETPTTDTIPRSASSLSHRRAQSQLSSYGSVTSRTTNTTSTNGRQLAQPPTQATPIVPLKASDVVPSSTYMERGQRWMEKEEAVSLRSAMEDMDLKKLQLQAEEEARIHALAQDEASELVFRHQNPEAAVAPDAPYRYNDHLRRNSYQHARTQSVGRSSGIGMVTGLARDIAPRSASGGSSTSGSGGLPSPTEFRDHNSQPEYMGGRSSLDSITETTRPSRKPYGSMSSIPSSSGSRNRRSSAKRNISGELASGLFTGSQIWEEPEQEDDVNGEGDRGRSTSTRDIPDSTIPATAPLRMKPRNPLTRVQFVQDLSAGGLPLRSNSTPPEPIKKRIQISEIHRNPPSQSRNPNYTANTPPTPQGQETQPALVNTEESKPQIPMKDGLEIRSDEIRQATSMRLSDRSPKLPTPTAVSDRPGRPIVSFDASWKPSEKKEADVKPEVRRRSPFDRRPLVQNKEGVGREDEKGGGGIQLSVSQVMEMKGRSGLMGKQTQSASVVPRIHLPDARPSIPTINLPDARPSIPIINLPDDGPTIPTINISSDNPSIPTINFPDDTPSISVSAPSIVVNGESSTQGRRPLPDPKTASRPLPRHAATVPTPRGGGHWSPAAGPRATATCHQCELPIEGRVVKLSGANEHFHPSCFRCFTCGTGLESLEIHPEPSSVRTARVARIKRRARGEHILEEAGETMAEDGDSRMRFYCHLDFHEAFAPKCKHCKTSIIGEHLVALGENWHYGHFFCAECGDPFEKGMTHIEKDGYAWCLPCQTKRTERQAPKCRGCRGHVIGEYTIALGGEWHEACFRCASCKGGLEDGFFPKVERGETRVLCVECIQRELKA